MKAITKMSEKDVALVIKQILEVLVLLESRNIMHSDIKPNNILLVNSGDVTKIKLVDFGFATKTSSNNRQLKCGTPGYMAPELIKGERYDCSIDMYSSGILLYTM